MANCNDCICSEACYYKAFNDERILKKRRDDVEKTCKSFVHRDSLKNAPTVYAVEVVRCKECLYYEKGKGYEPYCNHPTHGIPYSNDDDFCSYGERKEGADNG